MPIPNARKTVLKAVLDSLAAVAVSPLQDCVLRYGPLHSWSQGAAEAGVVIVSWGEGNGETSAGSGNNWWRNSMVTITGAIVDDFDNPEGSEDLRLDLADQLEAWVHSNRTLLDNEKVCSCQSVELPSGTLFADDETLFWMVIIQLSTRALRS
jgi:hypothetical protein